MPDELLAQLLAVAHEQLRWQRAATIPSIRETLDSVLRTTQLRRAFEMCDGTRTSSDIAAAVGVSPATMSRWTQGWRDLGLAYEVEGRRVRHLTSLVSVGLAIELAAETSLETGQAR